MIILFHKIIINGDFGLFLRKGVYNKVGLAP